jgi:hypothetical protein
MFVNWLRRVLRQALCQQGVGSCRRRATYRPRVEPLEGRLTPSGDFGFALAVTGSGLTDVESKAVTTDRAGNVYVTGQFFGTANFDPRPGAGNLTTNGATDLFVAKYTRAGALVWARQVGGKDFVARAVGTGIAVDDAGDVYTIGTFTGTVDFDPGPGTFNLTVAGNSAAAFLEKLDAAGNFVWVRQFSPHPQQGAFLNEIQPTALTVDFAGNVYETGQFGGVVDFGQAPGVVTLTNTRDPWDTFVAKLDTGGNLFWVRQFGGPPGTSFNNAEFGVGGIAVDRAGDVYTTGAFFGTVDFDPGPGTFNLTNSKAPQFEPFVTKLDAGGNFLWAKAFAPANTLINPAGPAIAVDSAGNAYTAIKLTGTANVDPGPGTLNLTSAGLGDTVVSKFDSAGHFVWARQFAAAGAQGFAGPAALAVDGDGNLYTAGAFQGTVDFDPGPGTFNLTSTSTVAGSNVNIAPNGATKLDEYVVKLDGGGNFLWARQFGGTGQAGGGIALNFLFGQIGGGIAVDVLGDIYTTGSFFGTVDFDPGPGMFALSDQASPPGQEEAAFVSQLRDTPARTPPPPLPTAQNVYVNPAWASLAPGTDPDGRGPATAIGVDAFAAVQPALNAVTSGGTVHLAAGTYSGPLVLYKRVRLVGSGSASTVLTGQGTGLDITAPGVEVSGLTVRGFSTGLFASGPAYLALSDVRLTGNATGGAITNVPAVLVAGGAGGNAYFATPSVLARQGDDALGYSGVRSLTVDAGGISSLTVFLNDSTAPDNVWLTAGAIARDKAPFLLFYRASGGTFGGGVSVVLSDAPEAVVVQSQLAGAPTAVYAEGGDDGFWVLVSESSGYAGLTIDGGAGTNGVAVLDQSGGAALQDLGPVIGTGVLQVTYPDGAVSRIAYQNLQQFLGGLPATPAAQ